MIGALLSSIGGRWNRFSAACRNCLRRRNGRRGDLPSERPTSEASRAAVPADPSVTVSTPPFVAPIATAACSAIVETDRPAQIAMLDAGAPAERQDIEQSLIEVLGVEALPLPRPRSIAVDPAIREKTLTALNGLRQIPALQSLAQGFLRAMNRPEVSIGEVVAAIEKDSALCVRVLRMANSVLVSPERRIEDLETAVQMLGVARVRKAAQALFTLRDANRVAEGFDWRHLWIHALGTAAIAEELEQQLRSNENSQIHLAALLHDVGKIVLSTIAPDAYREVLIVAWNENGRLEDLERERLGVDHREAGVMFARHNGLPPVAIEAIAHHDRPEEASEFRFEVALVAIANYLSKAHGLGFSGARLDDRDGELDQLSAWGVIEETCGFRPNTEAIEFEMNNFVAAVRADLRALRDEV